MDLHIIFRNILVPFGYLFIMTIAYHFCKTSVSKKDSSNATWKDKIKTFGISLFVVLLFSFMISQENSDFDINKFISYTIILYVPCVIGLIQGYDDYQKKDYIDRIKEEMQDEEDNKRSNLL